MRPNKSLERAHEGYSAQFIRWRARRLPQPLGAMSSALRIIAFISLVAAPCVAAPPPQVQFLVFPKSDLEALGQIDRLNVVVDCSWIAALEGVPELYNIRMGYDMPTQNLLEARPRLGAAAVTLSEWSGVIGVRVPSTEGAKSCFAVTVTAEGREGGTRTWKGKQLGLPGMTPNASSKRAPER
jgi:hypothetical protein